MRHDSSTLKGPPSSANDHVAETMTGPGTIRPEGGRTEAGSHNSRCCKPDHGLFDSNFITMFEGRVAVCWQYAMTLRNAIYIKYANEERDK
jgi:hypothetical protein